jgi:hypothetical protein
MRDHKLLSGFAALALLSGCLGTPTSIIDRPAGPPPSGLAVTLSISPRTSTTYLTPAITAAGDSVVVWAEYTGSDCVDYAATAGVGSGNALVVTITESSPPTMRYCTLELSTAIFRAVVRPAPRGIYPVELRQRMEWLSDGPEERVRARGSANLP